MIRRWLSLVGLVSLVAAPAHAQDDKVPRIEIGGNLSGVMSAFFESEGPFMLLGGGPRFTANLSPTLGLELLTEVMGPLENSVRTGFYLPQIKVPFRRSRGRGTLSFTVGALGLFSYQQHREVRVPRFDGSTLVHPPYRTFRATGLNNFVLGVTREEPLSRHVSGSLAVQAIVGQAAGFAVRLAGGVTFGPGGSR